MLNQDQVQRVGWHPISSRAVMPEIKTEGAAGFDLHACLPSEGLLLQPGQRQLVPTGFALVIPQGMEGQIRPRSGLALRHGITLLNSPGTIDADYRGEVRVLLVNLGQEAFSVAHGDRIAQIVFASLAKVRLDATSELPGTARGDAGFGSTGIS